MLATMLMPQEPPTSNHLASNKMSVALLPSAPMAYSQSTPSPSKRPKLSLAIDVPSSPFGKGSTSLRLDTLSATSPTSRNTFKNAYKPAPAHRSSNTRPQKPALAPLATDIATTDSQASRATSAESDSSASTLNSSVPPVPYKIAFNVVPILKNGPLPRKRSRAQSKAMFPAIKRVAFRTPLTEDVKNTKFTLKHSDIESSTSTISTLELSPSSSKEDTKAQDGQSSAPERKASPPPLKRDTSDEEDGESCPATPIAGRNKRSRQWAWTLDPVEPTTTHTKPSPAEVGSGNMKGTAS